MAARIIDGKKIAAGIRDQIKNDVARFEETTRVTPHLAAVLVGDDPASAIYVRNKQRACKQAAIQSTLHRLPSTTTQDELLQIVQGLNTDSNVHGILVQLPLPPHIEEAKVLDVVSPLKDVDAFHPENVGRITQGRPRFLPCTPHGIQYLLQHCGAQIEGAHVVILGRSEIVGKPLAAMLMQKGEGANATVTVCHSRTQGLQAIARTADILIAAIGRPRFVKAEMLRPDAVVRRFP